ncbi:hypothetical protein [Sphingobacterium sp. SGG-5]|nr:hypothetical protein [Sphingobacterium sp. SGG-5]
MLLWFKGRRTKRRLGFDPKEAQDTSAGVRTAEPIPSGTQKEAV